MIAAVNETKSSRMNLVFSDRSYHLYRVRIDSSYADVRSVSNISHSVIKLIALFDVYVFSSVRSTNKHNITQSTF